MGRLGTVVRCCAAAFILADASRGLGAELIVNGGFETGNFSGWTTIPASSGSLFSVENAFPHSGTFDARFGATQLLPDSISQTIPTVPGALYQITFWLKNDGLEPNQFQVDFNGHTLLPNDFDSGSYANTFPYTQYVFPQRFLDGSDRPEEHYTIATGTSTLLQIKAYHQPSFWRLDDVSVMRICDPFQTGSQQFFAPELPLAVPEGRGGGDVLFRTNLDQFVTGTGTLFLHEPSATSASISVCIDGFFTNQMKVTIEPVTSTPGPPTLVLWDHEQFAATAGQPFQHVEALANISSLAPFLDTGSNPPTYSFKLKVLDDRPGSFKDAVGDFIYIATLNSSVLTLNPTNPGHVGQPMVNIYSDEMFHPIPLSIEFGDPLTVFATAIGNPSSYQISRLGLRVTERVDINPLNPDPNHLLPTEQQHNSGIGPGVYIQDDVAQSPSSTTGVGLHFDFPDLPILPPGYYEVTATAWDSAGFTRSLTQHLTVDREFGFLSVTNLVRQLNATDGTTSFSATLNLINNTSLDSGQLRIRLVNVPGFAAADIVYDQVVAQLPAEQDFTPSEARSGPVGPLLSCSAQQVQVCGTIPAREQSDPDALFGIGFQAYAVLEQCDGTQAECANPNNADLWSAVDTIRITEGNWPTIQGFTGPGGGVNQDRRGGKGKNAPYVLDSLAIVGPATVSSSGSVQFQANATLKKATGATKTLTNVKVQWSASMFTINSTGLFQAGQVTANTPVMITATYTLGSVTKTQTVQVTVNAPVMARSAAAAQVAAAPEVVDEMADDDSSDEAADTEVASPQRKGKPKPPKPPNVTFSVTPTSLTEGHSATVTVSINKANTQDIAIHYSLSGTALLNNHFVVCGDPGTITIPRGTFSATARLTAIANDLNLGTESVTISLSPSSAYKLPPKKKAKATINITNVPPPLCP